MHARTVRRPIVVALMAIASVAMSGAATSTASAAFLVEEKLATKEAKFVNGGGCAPATVTVPLRRGAYALSIFNGPREGEALYAPGATDEKVGVVTDIAVRPGGRNLVRWTAEPLPGGCRPFYDEDNYAYDEETGQESYGPPVGYRWASAVYDFEVAHRLRRQVRLGRRTAASLASRALSRRYGDLYDYAEGYPRCRRPRRNRARCAITFFAGDVYWTGHVRVGVRTVRNHSQLRWSYRLSMLRVNDYCYQVNNLPWAQCTQRVRRSGKRLRVPGRLL